MRFEVPQFIEVEDKIIGPFTWKQFVYLAGSGGAAVVFFFTLPFFFFVLVSAPIVGLGVFLAFHKVNNRPFSYFLESSINYFRKNKLYLWRKGTVQVVGNEGASADSEAMPTSTQPAANLPVPSQNNISSLSRKLELEALEPK